MNMAELVALEPTGINPFNVVLESYEKAAEQVVASFGENPEPSPAAEARAFYRTGGRIALELTAAGLALKLHRGPSPAEVVALGNTVEYLTELEAGLPVALPDALGPFELETVVAFGRKAAERVTKRFQEEIEKAGALEALVVEANQTEHEENGGAGC